MAENGALRIDHDEFGEMTVAKRVDGIRHINIQNVGNPTQVIRLDHCGGESKLDLVLHLLRQGWTDTVPEATTGYFIDSPQEFNCSAMRPTSYFKCLAVAAGLFEKGVENVPHKWNDLHYQCLLRLHGDALKMFLDKMALGEFEDKWARQHLKTSGDPLVIADVAEPDEQEPDDGDDDSRWNPNLHLQPLLPALLDREEEWVRAKVTVAGWPTHKVIFGHCTSGAGRQRGYINCRAEGHNNCFHWELCDDHSSREAFIAFQMAWAIGRVPPCETREEHLGWKPDATHVAEIMAAMTLESFSLFHTQKKEEIARPTTPKHTQQQHAVSIRNKHI